MNIVLRGDAGIGAKTSLALRLVKGDFTYNTDPTISVTYWAHRLDVDGVNVKLDIWGLFRDK